MSRVLVIVLLAFPLLESTGARGAEVDGLQERGRSFLARHCVDCHGPDAQEAELRFDDMPVDLANVDTANVWKRVLEQVLFSEMPPADHEPQPKADERRAFVELVERALAKHGRGLSLDEKLVLPEYGNLVDHDRLFDGSVTDLPFTPARMWRQRPDIYRRMWGQHYGRKQWFSVKIGGVGRDTVLRGPHKGKNISGRYFARESFANPFYEYVHHASGFTDYATIVADQASLEALLTNAETMAEILTLGTPVTVVTEVKSKDSRHGNNHGMFVGGLETIRHERRGRIPHVFEKVMETEGRVSDEDFRAALEVAFELFLRRLPTDEDVAHYRKVVFDRNAELGHTTALQAVLIYVTVSPEFVYRMEMGLGPEDEHGRRMLSPLELVYALQYAFQDTPAFGVEEIPGDEAYSKNSDPFVRKALTESNRAAYRKDSWLAEAMQAGDLETREDVEKAVRRFLDGGGNLHPNHNKTIDSVKNPRVLRFFREFFGYHRAHSVFKDVNEFEKRPGFQQFHGHSAIRMMYDTDALVLDILEKDENVLEELLTTNRVFVSYWNGSNAPDQIQRAGGREKYRLKHDAQSYNLDPFDHEHTPNEAIVVPPEQRCGILTQPSWLVAHSGNFDNDPVRRGKWIREKLLAGTVLEVPITVDAQIPDDETKTLRERFGVVRVEECWRCHRKMNPLGMPFEAFNHVGRFRTEEKEKPVDTSGAITFSGEEQLDGDVANVRELMERLAKSDRVRQSFLRHVFRYWMGRNELLSDSKTLIAMDRAYLDSGGSFEEVLVTLLTSDSFLYRK